MEIKNLNAPFVISRNKLIDSKDLNHIKTLSDCYLYSVSPDYISQYRESNHTIYIIGYTIDIRNGLLSQKDISKNLINAYKNDGKIFIDLLDYISGRYVIIIDNTKFTSIYTDATGLKPVFYWKEIYASHEVLLRQIVNSNYAANISEPQRRLNGYLDYSNSKNILKVNPNFTYSVNGNAPVRIYPKKMYQTKSYKDVIDIIMPALEEQIKWLDNQDKKLYLSLTGGFDSKVTMALTKNIQEKISYFTYMRNTENANRTTKWIYDTDEKIVNTLVSNLNLNHQFLNIDDMEWTDEQVDQLSKHTTSNHSFKLGLTMNKELEDNSLHIKSTLYELGKVPFSDELENIRDLKTLYQIVEKWKPKNLNEQESVSMYESFLKRNDYKSVKSFNYHLPFLIYWETRMGNWHSNITQESDLNQDTFIIINNRFILDNFISLTSYDRKNNNLLKEIIKRKWPILNYFIPNSQLTLEDQFNELNAQNISSTNKKNIILRAFSNINIFSGFNKFEIYPLTDTLLRDDSHFIELENRSNTKKIITINSYYSKAPDLIRININEKIYDITQLNSPIKITILPKEIIKLKYLYSNNFDKNSWFEAGHLTLSFT